MKWKPRPPESDVGVCFGSGSFSREDIGKSNSLLIFLSELVVVFLFALTECFVDVNAPWKLSRRNGWLTGILLNRIDLQMNCGLF